MSRLRRYTRATIAFLGPVAGAFQGELSKPERIRALAKAATVWMVTRSSMAATIQEPSTMADVVVPLAAAAFTGVMDALSRWQQGDPKPDPNDAPPPAPLPTNPETKP